ncbi:sugar phosphate nucleotidyltransferase [Pseudomonas fluorescens]|uniref:sugar phosphate nucleotidyltransferase n=1 Tax=Pseudomonas fluorescens TaxID=294 RepID=UPI000AA21CC6
MAKLDCNGKARSTEEKPHQSKSCCAILSIYIYDNEVLEIVSAIKPFSLGELEIRDVNLGRLGRNKLPVQRLSRCFAWLDAVTGRFYLCRSF